MFRADGAMMRTQEPAFQICGGPVTQLQMIAGLALRLRLDLRAMRPPAQGFFAVAGMAIGFDRGRGADFTRRNMFQTLRMIARRMNQSYAAKLFCGNDHELFYSPLAADKSLVGLRATIEFLAVLTNHGAANFVQPGPCSLIGSKAQNALQVGG